MAHAVQQIGFQEYLHSITESDARIERLEQAMRKVRQPYLARRFERGHDPQVSPHPAFCFTLTRFACRPCEATSGMNCTCAPTRRFSNGTSARLDALK
jgi:hypothetical protein